MNELHNLNLKELLPSSIAGDETVRNICDAIVEKLQMINEKANLVLLLPRLDQLPENLVDELAWQYHVDFYDYAASLDKMLMYGKEASNRKQEIDRQHYTIPNQRPKDKHCGKI